VENSYRAVKMQANLINQVVRIEAENRSLRKQLSATDDTKESLEDKLYSAGLISKVDIQDERDLENILEPFENSMDTFLESMDNNSQKIQSLLSVSVRATPLYLFRFDSRRLNIPRH